MLRDPSPRALSVWRRVVKFLILWVDLFSKVVCVSQDLANQVRFCTEFQRCMKEGTAPRDAKYLRPPTAEYMSGEGFNAVFDLDSVLNKLASVRPTSWMDKCSSKLCQQGSVSSDVSGRSQQVRPLPSLQQIFLQSFIIMMNSSSVKNLAMTVFHGFDCWPDRQASKAPVVSLFAGVCGLDLGLSRR